MATIFLGNESYIVGSSREQKPTVDIGGAGAKYYETDTLNEYLFDGVEWHLFRSGVTLVSPMVDIDTSYVWNPDGTPAQVIETGLGQTKTTIYTWLNGVIQSETVVIT